ncbi:MAG: ADOP family duplicated permease [Vicinamibacterales bacterium]
MTDRSRRSFLVAPIADARAALRVWRRAPGLALVVAVSLGVGIGVNTVVFTWLQARVLRPVPGVTDARRLAQIDTTGASGTHPGVSWAEYRDLRDRLPAFTGSIAFRTAPFDVGDAAWSDRVPGLFVSRNYFDALGLRPALGRFFDARGDARDADVPEVVVSHQFWRTRLEGDPDAVGRELRVDGRALAVVGVAPERFIGTVMGLAFDLYVPAPLLPSLTGAPGALEARGARGYGMVGVLAPGASRGQAQAQLDAAMVDLARLYPSTNRGLAGEVRAFWDAARGPQRFLTAAVAVLQAVMILVLLAVCGNAATLALARAGARRGEVAVRLALGASRGRIVRLLLLESLGLAAAGVALALAIAWWGSEAMRAVPMPTPGGFRLQFDTSIDGLTVAFAAALGLAAGLVTGLAPAWHAARRGAHVASLRGGATPADRGRLRDLLIGAEVALALVTLVVATMFVARFRETQTTDPGFRRDGVMLAAYDLAGRDRAATAAAPLDFARRLIAGVEALPAVERAAIATSVPLDIHGSPLRFFEIEGRRRADGQLDQAVSNVVTPGYFDVMGIARLAGDGFAPLDAVDAPPQVVVNEALVRRFLPDVEPLGRWVLVAGGRYVIAGVVRTSRYDAFDEPPTPAIYFSFRDRPATYAELHVRTRLDDAAAVLPDVRRVVATLDPGLPLFNARTLADHVEANLVLQRIPARMFAVLGPMLLGLAAIGIYAVVAHTVTERRAEIGLRLALGAPAGREVARFVTRTLAVVAAGVLAGGVITAIAARQGVAGLAPPAGLLASVPLALFGVAALASWWPARRAARVDPLVTLRRD